VTLPQHQPREALASKIVNHSIIQIKLTKCEPTELKVSFRLRGEVRIITRFPLKKQSEVLFGCALVEMIPEGVSHWEEFRLATIGFDFGSPVMRWQLAGFRHVVEAVLPPPAEEGGIYFHLLSPDSKFTREVMTHRSQSK
jgi:hypothetical protein